MNHAVNQTTACRHVDVNSPIQLTLSYTPVNFCRLEIALKDYDWEKARHLVNCFRNGFPLHYNGPLESYPDTCPNSVKNLDILLPMISEEILMGRIAGPYVRPPFKSYRCSPLFLVEKRQPGKYRLIFNLSYPKGTSVNDYVDPETASVQYAGIDAAIEMLLKFDGPIFLAKADIHKAFKLLPVALADLHLLCTKINDMYYVIKSMPEGFTASCKNFEDFSSALEWLVKNFSKIETLIHYLDDFLFAANTYEKCLFILNVFIAICEYLGVPLAPEKLIYPTQVLEFLGLVFNTLEKKIIVPHDKVSNLLTLIENFEQKKKAKLKEIQSLIGALNFVCRAVAPGRAFLRRLIDATCGITNPYHYVRISKGMKADLSIWKRFLLEFNGDVFWLPKSWECNYDLGLFSDASGAIGWGATLNSHWVQGRWSKEVLDNDFSIEFKELFPIVVSCVVWGPKMKNKRIMFHSDNESIVAIINKKTSSEPDLMILVRHLVFSCLKYNIMFRAKFIPGKSNAIADAISRFNMQEFRRLAPKADLCPSSIPEEFHRFCQV